MPAQALPASTILLLSALYFSQGLPSGFLAHALPALMRQEGISLELIGLLKLLALPWLLKWLWAPIIDRHPRHRSGWVIVMQLLLACLVLVLSSFNLSTLSGLMLVGFLLVIILINTTAATQDIATDGIAVERLPNSWLGLGNSIQVGAYKVGMIISGSGLLLAVNWIGWQMALSMISIILIALLVPILLDSRTRQHPTQTLNSEATYSLLQHWSNTYKGFFKQSSIHQWLLILVTFKMADSLGSAMIKPLLIDHGVTLPEIAHITFWSSLAGLGAACAAGLIYFRLTPKTCLILFGGLQAFAIGTFALISLVPNLAHSSILLICLFEQAADGMSTVALFAAMMHFSRKAHAGSDYTLQACLQLFLASLIGGLSGFVAAGFGYTQLYLMASGLGLISCIIVILYFPANKITI